MKHYKTINEIEENYLCSHLKEIDDYVVSLFDDYARDGDSAALLSCLRMICRVKGVSHIAEPQRAFDAGVQEPQEEHDTPQFESIYNLMLAIGYRLVPQKLE